MNRLIEGNVAMQGFTIVTSSPFFLNFEKNEAPTTISDVITLKTILEV